MLPTSSVSLNLRVEDLRFSEMCYFAHRRTPLHYHTHTSLILVLAGTVEETGRKQTYLRTPSTLVLIPAGEPHATSCPESVCTFEIDVPSTWLERIQQVTPKLDQMVDFQQGAPVATAIRLYQEFQSQTPLTPLMLEGLMLELLVQIARDDTSAKVSSTACPRWLLQVRDYLRANFTERLSLETIAATVGVHPSHLVRAFRQHFHCTIGDYLRNLRLERAHFLLTHSDTPLSEVALEMGYSDQSHFSTAFRRQTGIAPGEFRRMSRRC